MYKFITSALLFFLVFTSSSIQFNSEETYSEEVSSGLFLMSHKHKIKTYDVVYKEDGTNNKVFKNENILFEVNHISEDYFSNLTLEWPSEYIDNSTDLNIYNPVHCFSEMWLLDYQEGDYGVNGMDYYIQIIITYSVYELMIK
jgi:hypothetical protein